MSLPRGIPSFDEFWPIYLGEHRRAGCRALHYVSAVAAVVLVGWAVHRASPWPLLAIPVVSYGFAWIGHGIVERNRPATWGYPLWSLRAEFRMTWLAATGRLRDELARVGIRSR